MARAPGAPADTLRSPASNGTARLTDHPSDHNLIVDTINEVSHDLDLASTGHGMTWPTCSAHLAYTTGLARACPR